MEFVVRKMIFFYLFIIYDCLMHKYKEHQNKKWHKKIKNKKLKIYVCKVTYVLFSWQGVMARERK